MKKILALGLMLWLLLLTVTYSEAADCRTLSTSAHPQTGLVAFARSSGRDNATQMLMVHAGRYQKEVAWDGQLSTAPLLELVVIKEICTNLLGNEYPHERTLARYRPSLPVR